jgi:hypothetical protein
MLIGTHTAVDKPNLVLKAGPDLDLSLRTKRERMRLRQYNVLGCVEQIIFENDKACRITNPDTLARAKEVGRLLYWPDNCPLIARTMPEEDLIFTEPLRLPLPNVPAARKGRILSKSERNPYGVNQEGYSTWKVGDPVNDGPTIPQRIEQLASGKHRNFLIFHPIAQIIVLMAVNGHMVFGSAGSHRMPLSSLRGFDDRKMALLIDPYTGEAYFTGGAYGIGEETSAMDSKG